MPSERHPVVTMTRRVVGVVPVALDVAAAAEETGAVRVRRVHPGSDDDEDSPESSACLRRRFGGGCNIN